MADAPRLRGYIGRFEGRPVIVTPASDWAAIEQGSTVLVDLAQTALDSLVEEATILAAAVMRDSAGQGTLEVYREDLNDSPRTVNQDIYTIFFDLRTHPQIERMIGEASTGLDPNMHQFLDEHAFLIKQTMDAETHWSTALPQRIEGLYRRNSIGGI